jgi:hypothetical protein
MYDRTDLVRKRFDRQRDRKMPDAALKLILNAGTAEQSELEIDGGWWPEKQQKFGEVNSIYKVSVTARDELAAETMNQADRLNLDGVLYQFNFDPPLEEPRVWTLYATEMKAGGIR